jgi:hypothetical protein
MGSEWLTSPKNLRMKRRAFLRSLGGAVAAAMIPFARPLENPFLSEDQRKELDAALAMHAVETLFFNSAFRGPSAYDFFMGKRAG